MTVSTTARQMARAQPLERCCYFAGPPSLSSTHEGTPLAPRTARVAADLSCQRPGTSGSTETSSPAASRSPSPMRAVLAPPAPFLLLLLTSCSFPAHFLLLLLISCSSCSFPAPLACRSSLLAPRSSLLAPPRSSLARSSSLLAPPRSSLLAPRSSLLAPRSSSSSLLLLLLLLIVVVVVVVVVVVALLLLFLRHCTHHTAQCTGARCGLLMTGQDHRFLPTSHGYDTFLGSPWTNAPVSPHAATNNTSRSTHTHAHAHTHTARTVAHSARAHSVLRPRKESDSCLGRLQKLADVCHGR